MDANDETTINAAADTNAADGRSGMKKVLNSARKRDTMDSLGDFVVSSGRVAVCDPTAFVEERQWIDGVKNGEWRGAVSLKDERPYGDLVSVLIAEAKDGKPEGPWQRQHFEVQVEAGQACICDAHVFLAATDSDCERWQRRCFQLSSRRRGGGIIKGGVVSSTGYGDGFYACWVRRDRDGKAVSVMIDFNLEQGRRIMAALCRR